MLLSSIVTLKLLDQKCKKKSVWRFLPFRGCTAVSPGLFCTEITEPSWTFSVLRPNRLHVPEIKNRCHFKESHVYEQEPGPTFLSLLRFSCLLIHKPQQGFGSKNLTRPCATDLTTTGHTGSFIRLHFGTWPRLTGVKGSFPYLYSWSRGLFWSRSIIVNSLCDKERESEVTLNRSLRTLWTVQGHLELRAHKKKKKAKQMISAQHTMKSLETETL